MNNVIKEYNTYRIRASFVDDSGAAVTATGGSYRVDDITGGRVVEVIPTSTLIPTTTYYDIIIPSSSNVILDQEHTEEKRLVTVTFTYGSSRRGSGEYEYTIQNLKKIETLLGL
jgi:hypothetical protein